MRRYYFISDDEVTNMAKLFLAYEDCTLRKLAEMVETPKSTIHNVFRTRLKNLDLDLYDLVDKKLKKNKQEAARRAGIATAKKYVDIKNKVLRKSA